MTRAIGELLTEAQRRTDTIALIVETARDIPGRTPAETLSFVHQVIPTVSLQEVVTLIDRLETIEREREELSHWTHDDVWLLLNNQPTKPAKVTPSWFDAMWFVEDYAHSRHPSTRDRLRTFLFTRFARYRANEAIQRAVRNVVFRDLYLENKSSRGVCA